MKNRMYILLSILFFSCGQPNRGSDEENSTVDTISATIERPDVISNPSTVEEIKQEYSRIDDQLKRAALDSTSIKYDCSGERSGTVTYFYNGDALRLIKHSYSEYSHFSATEYYYMSDQKPFFVHSNSVTWSFEEGKAAEGATKDNITEYRTYIADNKPLLCLEKKYIKRSAVADNPNPENIENKEVTCKPSEPISKNVEKLIAFKSSADQSCLAK